jgi:hypothetical protein
MGSDAPLSEVNRPGRWAKRYSDSARVVDVTCGGVSAFSNVRNFTTESSLVLRIDIGRMDQKEE